MVNKQEVVNILTNFSKFEESQEDLIRGTAKREHFYCCDCNHSNLGLCTGYVGSKHAKALNLLTSWQPAFYFIYFRYSEYLTLTCNNSTSYRKQETHYDDKNWKKSAIFMLPQCTK